MNPEALAVVCRHLSVRMRERLVVGLHLPGAGTTPSHARARRGALVATLTAGALLLSGCSDEAARFGFPEPRSACGGGVPHDELLVTRVAAGVLGLDPRAAEATGRTEVDT